MNEVSTEEFERLMAEVAAGSEAAVWQLADTYTPYILRAVRHSLPTKIRRRVDSQDIVQMLWASVLLGGQGLGHLKSPEELIAYLYKAAKNKVVDASRRHLSSAKYDMNREQNLRDYREHPGLNGLQEMAIRSRDPTPSQCAAARERWQQILAEASERDRMILQLRLQRFSFDEISSKLNISNPTARRAIQGLIDQLAK